jgi:hypothetical protein
MTLGFADFIRVPWPAARMTAALAMTLPKLPQKKGKMTICDVILPHTTVANR